MRSSISIFVLTVMARTAFADPVYELPPPPDRACCEEAPPPRLPLFVAEQGWSLAQNENREWVFERKRRAPRASVYGPGLAVWLTTYVATAAGGLMFDGNALGTIPLIGGFVSAGFYADDASHMIGYAMSSVLQIGGFVTFLVGLAAGEKMERLPVRIMPMSYSDGGGVSLGGRF